MHPGGHRPGASGARLRRAARARGAVDPMVERGAALSDPAAGAEHAARHRDLRAAPQEPADAQGHRGGARDREPRGARSGDRGMSPTRDYENIPGTYVYDAVRGRLGYALNMFCMSLN